MVRDALNRAFAPTVPNDLKDPPRFSQALETTRDVIVLELRKFFDNAAQVTGRKIELPTIEKYNTFADGNDSDSTPATVVRKYPERLERLPHVAVMTANGQERRLTIGPPFVSTVQDPAQITAATFEPYALTDGDSIVFQTLPDAKHPHLDTIVFTADRFPTLHAIGAALAVDVARVINEQASHVFASVYDDGVNKFVRVEAGGPVDSEDGRTPTEIVVVPSNSTVDQTVFGFSRVGTLLTFTPSYPTTLLTATTPSGLGVADVGNSIVVDGSAFPYFNDGRFKILAFTSFGGIDTLTVDNHYGRLDGTPGAAWYVGARDDNKNPIRPPKNRYGMAWDLSCQIDVLTEDENTRGEMVDLVLAFFSFFLESKYFTFWGRSTFDEVDFPNEYFQIVINPPFRSASENEFPRPGDGTGKVYVNSFNLDVTTSMYIDRELYFPGTNTPLVIDTSNLVEDDTLPRGND